METATIVSMSCMQPVKTKRRRDAEIVKSGNNQMFKARFKNFGPNNGVPKNMIYPVDGYKRPLQRQDCSTNSNQGSAPGKQTNVRTVQQLLIITCTKFIKQELFVFSLFSFSIITFVSSSVGYSSV